MWIAAEMKQLRIFIWMVVCSIYRKYNYGTHALHYIRLQSICFFYIQCSEIVFKYLCTMYVPWGIYYYTRGFPVCSVTFWSLAIFNTFLRWIFNRKDWKMDKSFLVALNTGNPLIPHCVGPDALLLHKRRRQSQRMFQMENIVDMKRKHKDQIKRFEICVIKTRLFTVL